MSQTLSSHLLIKFIFHIWAVVVAKFEHVTQNIDDALTKLLQTSVFKHCNVQLPNDVTMFDPLMYELS